MLEYQWPPGEGNTASKWYMLQEQVGEFLDVRSMMRRYPGKRKESIFIFNFVTDLERRPLDIEEKKYLLDIEAVNETQCNMGKNEWQGLMEKTMTIVHGFFHNSKA